MSSEMVPGPLDEASPNVALIALHKHCLVLGKRLAVDISPAVKNLLGSSRKTVCDRHRHYAVRCRKGDGHKMSLQKPALLNCVADKAAFLNHGRNT